MQQPTLQSVRVRSTRDALQIFYAVARRALPMITRRLDAEERRAIVPGNVYIWEERCANAEITGLGMERWTDGISWSASRIAQEFLFYRQRESDQDSSHPSAQWANIMKRRDPRTGGPSCPRSEADRLIKQTYSVHVSLPEDRVRGVTRKWHLTAYFSQTTLDSLNTIDMIPGVGDVVVPRGWFKNARANKGRGGDALRDDDIAVPYQDPWMSTDPSHAQYRTIVPPAATVVPEDSYRWGSPASTHSHPTPPAHHRVVQDPYRQADDFTLHPLQEGRQPLPSPHPSQLPTLSDSGLQYYRDISPFTQSSSASSEMSSSPRSFAAPSTPSYTTSGPATPRTIPPERSLVPLAILKSLNPPVRDAMSEDCLRRLAGSGTPPYRPDYHWPEPQLAQVLH